MTLLELVELWGTRYGLERKEVLELGSHVAAYVDGGPIAVLEPMTVPLAAKLRLRSAKEAARRLVAERLLGDAEVIGKRAVAPVVWEPPLAVPRSSVSPTPVRKIRCSLCRGEGHTLRTCPTIARPSGIVKGTGGSR